LDPYFAQKIADEKLYTKVPEQIWIEKLLVEKDKSYHIWGKVFENEDLHEFWLPKGAVIKTHNVEKVEIDYSKYSHRPPLNHQKEAIEKLVGCKRFILADDMGLGKTTSTIIATLETGAKKILIISPASLKINWMREIQNYTDRSVYICEGKNYSTEHDFVIINYDIIKNFYDIKDKENSPIYQTNFDLIIIDEAHYLQNSQAQRTKLVNHFAKQVDRLWLLTGTPMTSRPINYYNLLNLIESPVAQNWMAYAIRYCEGYQFKAGPRKVWNVKGASNLEELRDRTSRQVLRRLKEDVLDLPDKIITPVYLRLKSRLYEELMGEYYDWYRTKTEESSSLTLQFSKLTKVRQIIAEEKISSTIELCENIIEQGKKVIIFTNFTNSLQKLVEHFGKQCVFLDGSCSQPQRQYAVDQFQNNDKINVFVGNIKAAGVGITLTAAEAVIMNDLSFLPSDHSQSEDRAYRYGQKSNVSVYYPIFENTIEGVIYDILSKKKSIIETVMGDNLDKTDFVEEVLNSINNSR
jgi:SNF2 family DNA or RNA helicase